MADVGRPTVFESKYIEQAFKFALLGLTNDEMADAFDVSHQTFYNWCKLYPEFLESLKRGRADADAHVSKSLYRQALKGNTTAMIFWLKNRQPSKWRDTAMREDNDSSQIRIHGGLPDKEDEEK
jgi:hypothetical protein